MSETKRQTELDILRFLATLAVIVIHGVELSSPVGISPLVWCVPVFFMISGRFFLDPERNVTPERMLRKTIPHIVTAFVFWSAVFTIYYVVSGAYSGLNAFGILNEFIRGPYHLWFLYSLAGLYLLTPILRRIAADERVLLYTLLIFGIVNICTEYLIYLPKLGEILEEFVTRLGVMHVSGYMGYFLLGYYISKKKDAIAKKAELTIYVLGTVMFAGTIAAECLISSELRNAEFVKQYMKPNVIVFSAALYTFFVKRVSQCRFSEKTVHLFEKLTEHGLGVYCAHALINELLPAFPFPGLYIVSSVLRVAIIYVLSFSLTWVIRKIPLIGRKIT